MKYRLYGLVVETDFPFRNRLIKAEPEAVPDISFSIASEFVPNGEASIGRRFEAHAKHADGTPTFFIDDYVDRIVLAFPYLVQYHVYRDQTVVAERLGDVTYDLIEIHFLGLVASFVLERRGILALHASAIVQGDRAVGFLASNKGGKTSLAVAFVREGAPLLTDDILAVDVGGSVAYGASAYPQMRMWPEHAEALIGQSEALERVLPDVTKRLVPLAAIGPGRFSGESHPLQALFVPDRREDSDASIQIERLPSSEAFRAVLSNGFIAQIAEASGMARSRFNAISHLIAGTPIFNLKYPSGIEHLPAIRAAILKHLGDLD